MKRTLEICVDSHEGLRAAVAGGADRIELCAALSLGGLTPSEALMQAGRRCPVPVYVMIRPRPGGFLFSEVELADMELEIDHVRALGLAGVVLGAGSETGLDWQALARLADRAKGLGRTLHRVVDLQSDPSAMLNEVAALGFERVLTSGGALTAIDGTAIIARMVQSAPDGLSIMAGSGVAVQNVKALVKTTAVNELHSSARVKAPASGNDLVRLGFALPEARETDAETVSRLAQALREA